VAEPSGQFGPEWPVMTAHSGPNGPLSAGGSTGRSRESG
jgi:hypothetical protein